MRVLYFAWLRERVGMGEEEIEPPDSVVTVADLVGWLAGRDAAHARAFVAPEAVRCAVDQAVVGRDAPIAGAREIAFFPPVTGG